MTPVVPPTSERAARNRWRVVIAALTVALVAPCLAAATAPATAAPTAARSRTAGSDLTMIAANLLSPQSYTRFQKDAKEVFSHRPDLVAFNEVAFRNDSFLAPPGYELWRSPKDRFTKATPVAWRSDRYTALDQGTRMISDWRGRPPGRQIEIGRRQANWVTLESDQGRVLSLVSVHLAPRNTGMPDLLRRSVRRLGALVDQLASHGPVLVGGDFNVPVGGHRYPADLLAAAGMKSTYQLLGTRFGTSDHGDGRATIDYVFVRGEGELEVDQHYPVELNSDHDAVVAGLSWTTPAATVEVVRNHPNGARREQRAVLNRVAHAVNGTAAGERVEVTTRGLSLRPVFRALKRAYLRGVSVRLTTLSPRLTNRERWLRRLYARSANGVFQRCRRGCAHTWSSEHPPSQLDFSNADGQPVQRIEVSRRLRKPVITRRTRAVVRGGDLS